MDELEALDLLLNKKKPFDEIYSQMYGGRNPSSSGDIEVVPNYSVSPPKQLSPTTIEASPVKEVEQPKILMVGNSPKSEAGKFVKENVNNNLDFGLQSKSEIQDRAKKAQSDLEEIKQAQKSLLPEKSNSYSPNNDRRQMKESILKSLESQKIPDRDMMSELILSLGPALLGVGFGGKAGYTAAAPAAQQSRSLYETIRKDRIEKAKADKDETKLKLASLNELEKEDRDTFFKNENLKNQLIESKAKIYLGMQNLKGDELKRATADLIAIDQKLSQLAERGTYKAADADQKDNSIKSRANSSNRADRREVGQLRKEYNSRPTVKDFNQIDSAYRKISSLSPNAAGDMSMIFNYMKMLDPGSTVREGEQAQVEQARGVPESVLNAYNKLVAGEKLTDKQRSSYKQEAKVLYNAQKSKLLEVQSEFSDLAKAYGYNPNEIFRVQKDYVSPDSESNQNTEKISKLKDIFAQGKITKELYDKKLKELGGK